jgi:N-acetylglutamate synthase-like GNAT family acetyltransferase
VSHWRGKCLVAFKRATSDSFSHAVLWDIVMAEDLQGRGLNPRVVEELLHSPAVAGAERVDLMTTNSTGFYLQLGFRDADPQQLLVLKR